MDSRQIDLFVEIWNGSSIGERRRLAEFFGWPASEPENQSSLYLQRLKGSGDRNGPVGDERPKEMVLVVSAGQP